MAEETLLGLTLFNRVTFRGIVNLNDEFFLLTRDPSPPLTLFSLP
jgi:hypothetical protein